MLNRSCRLTIARANFLHQVDMTTSAVRENLTPLFAAQRSEAVLVSYEYPMPTIPANHF